MPSAIADTFSETCVSMSEYVTLNTSLKRIPLVHYFGGHNPPSPPALFPLLLLLYKPYPGMLFKHQGMNSIAILKLVWLIYLMVLA